MPPKARRFVLGEVGDDWVTGITDGFAMPMTRREVDKEIKGLGKTARVFELVPVKLDKPKPKKATQKKAAKKPKPRAAATRRSYAAW